MANSHSTSAPPSRRRYEENVQSNRMEMVALFIILVLPVFATLAYGATEIWSLIPLSALTLILFVIWAMDGSRTGRFVLSSSKLQVPLIFLIGIGLVQLLPLSSHGVEAGSFSASPSSALSLDPYSTRIFVVRLVLFLIFFALALRYVDRTSRISRFATALVIFGSLVAFAGILQRLASPEAIYGMRPTPQAIPFGPFINQHHFAAFMTLCLGPAFAMLTGGGLKRDRRGLLLLAVLLMGIAIVMTGSRGGMIAAAAVVTAVVTGQIWRGSLLRKITRRSALSFAVGALAMGVVLVSAVIYLAGADPLIRGIGLQAGQADPTSGRLHFWSVGWRIFLDHPLLGAGFDAFGVAFTRYDTWNGFFRVEQAHNDYLQMLADGGILSFLCVGAFLVILIRKGTETIKRADLDLRRSIAIGALAACVGIAVHSFFDFPLRTSSNAYFFLLLVVLATVDIKEGVKGLRTVGQHST